MNVNSRGHNLDTRFEQHFPKKNKTPTGVKSRWVYPPPRIGLKNINPSRTDLRGEGQQLLEQTEPLLYRRNLMVRMGRPQPALR